MQQHKPVLASLTIIRYRRFAGLMGFFSMALFRLPLMRRKSVRFWRLMGTGLNGTFDIKPDLGQWAIMAAHDPMDLPPGCTGDRVAAGRQLEKLYGSFIAAYVLRWSHSFHTYLLQPIEGHGTWGGRPVFGELPKQTGYEGPIAILTRATIRLSRLRRFWSHVAPAAAQMVSAPGFIRSYGIGEVPWIRQATFSIWESRMQMRDFAYRGAVHQDIIRKTHSERWYSEDMFVRFRILALFSSHNNPLPSAPEKA